MSFNISEKVECMSKIQQLCSNIFENPENVDAIANLRQTLENAPPEMVRVLEKMCLGVFYTILKRIAENKLSYKISQKQTIVDTFKIIFDKIEIKSQAVFFNFFGFLVNELYDTAKHTVFDIPEEYKLSIVECTTSLAKSISTTTLFEIYVKENAAKFSQMLFALLHLCKNEEYKQLRISSIICLTSIARVLKDDDFNDPVLTNQVAEVFIFFLPGIASQLKTVALSDEKVGSKIPALALKAWGRIVTVLMRDYRPSDAETNHNNLQQAICKLDEDIVKENIQDPKRFKNDQELQEYISTSERSEKWYKATDEKLRPFVVSFLKLTHHSHPNVRKELLNTCRTLLDNCLKNMPQSMSAVVEIVITLSQDEDDSIGIESRAILEELTREFFEFGTSRKMKVILENLEGGFYDGIKSLPRKFNGIDEGEQLAALNLISGYIFLFNSSNLVRIFNSQVHLNELLQTLLHISQFETSAVSILEMYTTEEIDTRDFQPNFKNFRYFKSDKITEKIEQICHSVARYGALGLCSDYLLDLLQKDPENANEAIFLINGLITGIDPALSENDDIIKNIMTTYTDQNFWYTPLTVEVDAYGYQPSLGEAQRNVIRTCLLIEGVGRMALTLQKKFDRYLLTTLYLVLERAGSSHPLVKNTGLSTLFNISVACEYTDVADLIRKNNDYISFHVSRKLNKSEQSAGVLNVLTVIMRYSSIDSFDSTADIIQKLLIMCENPKEAHINSCLQVFKMFMQSLKKWLNISNDDITNEPLKTKQQKEEEMLGFQVSGINSEGCHSDSGFSDEIMGKTAEEMYREDMERSQKELEEECNPPDDEEYKKPEPPSHIKLAASVLSKTLHFLPSKNKQRKLLTLEVLTCGLVILKEWENDLLPLVHQIWSPLVDRFKEIEDPLVINCSFKLLAELARLSKDFIRSRTANEVLPSICALLEKLSKESYLKDKGSAYRYTQSYKLQVTVLEKLARILTDLDMLEKDIELAMQSVFPYLSDKQPLPLQKSAVEFFKTLHFYDPEPVTKKFGSWTQKGADKEFVKNLEELEDLVVKS